MSTIGSYLGWKNETTQNTRAVPDKFVGLLQESLRETVNPIVDNAIYAGRRMPVNFSDGPRTAGGSVRVPLTAETLVTAMQQCVGGTIATSGPASGVYTHVLTPGALPSATYQKVLVDSGGNAQVFEYPGSMVDAWSVTQNSGQRAELQLDLFSYFEDDGQSAVTAAYDAAPTFMTFRHLAVDIGGTTVCPDSFTLSGRNGLDRNFKSCAADAGRATIREMTSKREVTLNIPRDFPGVAEHAKRKAGTAVSVSAGWTNGDSTITFTGQGYLMGDTATVSGPDQMLKETLQIRLFHGTADASALTVTVENDEATP